MELLNKKKIDLQKRDGGQSGRQDLMKTVELSERSYISNISDLKKTAVRGIHFRFQF